MMSSFYFGVFSLIVFWGFVNTFLFNWPPLELLCWGLKVWANVCGWKLCFRSYLLCRLTFDCLVGETKVLDKIADFYF